MKKIIVLLLVIIVMPTMVQAASLQDVEGLYCENAVDSLAYLNIINGTGDNLYEPFKKVTRAELSKMIVNVLQLKETNEKSFVDIENHWGKQFIQTAASNGILNGYTDGTFRPNQSVTYAEAIAILLRSMGYTNLENGEGVWYQNYVTAMQQIGLSNGTENFAIEEAANRGNIAVLLWNAMQYRGNRESILERSFPNYQYIENEKVIAITTQNNKIYYQTEQRGFYVDNAIDFSDLGGFASGFIDTTTNTICGLIIDEGRNLEKISGSSKKIKELGYDTFTSNMLMGYGDKEYAQYMEVFVNQKTNKVVRAVFYDTRESHFAEKLKIGTNKISIESKDVYDESIIIHKSQTIQLKILRTESVKDIRRNALLVCDGKVVDWESVPNNSTIREIRKDLIYTYVHRYMDVNVSSSSIGIDGLKIGNVYYPFAEECICENVDTRTTMKLKEGLTTVDLQLIATKDKSIRVYLNEFDEITKLEFTYDIWEMKEYANYKEMQKSINSDLKKVGVVSNLDWNVDSKNNTTLNITVTSYPSQQKHRYQNVDKNIQLGDLMCETSGEKLTKVTDKTKFDHIQLVTNYNGVAYDNKIGIYALDDNADYIEVVLEKSNDKDEKYSQCTMKVISKDDFIRYTHYYMIHLVLNKEDKIVRVYALREMGNDFRYGIIRNVDYQYSGDKIKSRTVSILGEDNMALRYLTLVADLYDIGDLVIYEVTESKKEDVKDTMEVTEAYRTGVIGNKRDLIIKSSGKGLITFTNSDHVIDLKKDSFELNGRQYFLDDYTFIEAQVKEDSSLGGYVFRSFSCKSKNTVKMPVGYRVAVDELTKTIVVYGGYKG